MRMLKIKGTSDEVTAAIAAIGAMPPINRITCDQVSGRSVD
jgi:hypothetical protein